MIAPVSDIGWSSRSRRVGETVCHGPLGAGNLLRVSLAKGVIVKQRLATAYFTPDVLTETRGPQWQARDFTMADVRLHAVSRLETVEGQLCWRPTRKGRLLCEDLDQLYRAVYLLVSHEKDFPSHGNSCRKCLRQSRFGWLCIVRHIYNPGWIALHPALPRDGGGLGRG
jgi:hypothetical protein